MHPRPLAAQILAVAAIGIGVLMMHGLDPGSIAGPEPSGHHDAPTSGDDGAHPIGSCCLWVIVGVAGIGALLVGALSTRGRLWSGAVIAVTECAPARALAVTVAGRAPPSDRSLAVLGISRR